MNASEELRDYVARLHTRLRLGAVARGPRFWAASH